MAGLRGRLETSEMDSFWLVNKVSNDALLITYAKSGFSTYGDASKPNDERFSFMSNFFYYLNYGFKYSVERR